MECSGEGRLCFRLQNDRIAQAFQLSNEPLLNLLFIDGGKVISPFLVVGLTSLDHVIENHQNTVTNGDGSPLCPPSCTDPTVLLPQIVLRVTCRMGRLHQHRFGPAIALTDATTELFATGLMMARTVG